MDNTFIKHFLKTATDNFLSKFDSVEFSEVIRNNGFIAGGAIRCLLMDQTIKDFDVYFKDDISRDKYLDLFNRGMDGTKGFEVHYNNSTKYAHTYYSFADVFQIIHKYAGDPLKMIEKFDFTNCMAYYDIKTEELFIHPKMIEAIEFKRLAMNEGCFNPVFSIKRFIKFNEQGFKPDSKCLLDLCLRVRDASDEDIKEFQQRESY